MVTSLLVHSFSKKHSGDKQTEQNENNCTINAVST